MTSPVIPDQLGSSARSVPAANTARVCAYGASSVRVRTALVALALLATSFQAAWGSCIRPQDEFIIVDSRPLGGAFCRDMDWQRLRLYRLVNPGSHLFPVPLDEFYASDDPARLNLIYVHGNRIERGEDITRGLTVYRALLRHMPDAPPLRMIVFSWPAGPIPGPLRDFRTKAQRADPSALHLAWFLSRMHGGEQLAIIGYSYGARVVGGALHLLAGGTLRGYALPAPANLAPARVVYIAAAVHCDWLLPGRPHGMAMQRMDRLVLINNHCDPAMRFYRLADPHVRPVAMGLHGPALPAPPYALGTSVYQVDACREVGKHHSLVYYLGSAQVTSLAARTVFAPAPRLRHPP